jgi:predicted permease
MPDWKALVAARLASLTLRPEREREIVEELSQHLGDRFHELRADGLDEDAAVRAVIDEIDEGDLLAREMRTLQQSLVPEPIAPGLPRRRLAADLLQDVAYAGRVLRKSPGFAAAVVATLALGIGANTAIFSLVNATLLERLPVADRDRLFYVTQADGRQSTVSYPAYASVRDASRLIESLAAWGDIAASLNADGETELVSGAIVTGNYFATLGVLPARGRLLTPNDDRTPGAHPVVVISHKLWQGRFGSRDNIVGHDVRLNGRPFTIVGVTPADFPGAEVGVWQDIYTPMMMQAWMRPPRAGYSGDMDPDLLNNRNNGWLAMFGKLKPGVTHEQAGAELEGLAARQRPGGPPPNRRAPTVSVVPIDVGEPRSRRVLSSIALLLGAVVGAVLLIACANVANLLLARAAARRREVAIRLAIGASRLRILRQLLTESLVLALIGGAAGVVLAVVLMALFKAMPPPPGALPIAVEPRLDRTVLLFSLALSMVTGLVFGVAPAWQASRPELVPSLKDDASLADRRRRRVNLKTGLVIAEVAVAVVLLIGGGLFVRSLRAIKSVDSGLAISELVTGPMNINLLRYTKAQGRDFYQQLVERLERLPGVAAAGLARIPPLMGSARLTVIRLEGRPDGHGRPLVIGENAALANVVTPGYFETLGVPLIAGRDFYAQDLEDHPLVAIVSETFVRKFFPAETPIGKRFSTGYRNAAGEWTEVIGVVRDSKYRTLDEEPVPVVYMPLSQRHESGMTLFVRSTLPAATLIPHVRGEIQRLERDLPIPDLTSMEQSIGAQLYTRRMGASLLAVFGGLALLLASLGVYGVLAFSISRRQHELGVRMAVGADRRTIFALVLREGLVLVAIGLAIGLVASANLTRLISGFLFGVGTLDAVTFVMVPVILAVVALIACYLPARRATRVDPVVALRNE